MLDDVAPRRVQVQERRDRMRAEHLRVRPRAVVEAGQLPPDRVEAAVDVLDEVAFVVAGRPWIQGPACARQVASLVITWRLPSAWSIVMRAIIAGTDAGRPWPGRRPVRDDADHVGLTGARAVA